MNIRRIEALEWQVILECVCKCKATNLQLSRQDLIWCCGGMSALTTRRSMAFEMPQFKEAPLYGPITSRIPSRIYDEVANVEISS